MPLSLGIQGSPVDSQTSRSRTSSQSRPADSQIPITRTFTQSKASPDSGKEGPSSRARSSSFTRNSSSSLNNIQESKYSLRSQF